MSIHLVRSGDETLCMRHSLTLLLLSMLLSGSFCFNTLHCVNCLFRPNREAQG